MKGESRPRLVTGPFLLVVGATLAFFITTGILLPAVPLFTRGPLGGGNVAVGLAVGTWSVSALLVRPLSGLLGDRYGRRPIMVAGAALAAASVGATLAANSLPVLIALRLGTGAGDALFFVGAASAINDLAPPERRGEAVSLFSVAPWLGGGIGPLIGETALDAGGFDAVWLVAAGSAAIAALASLRVPETRAPHELTAPSTRRRLLQPAALPPGLVMLTAVFGAAGFVAFVALYARDLGLEGSAFVFLTFSAVVLSVRVLGARIPDALGAHRVSRAALILSGLGLVVVAGWGNIVGLFAGTVIIGLGQALAAPALMSIAVERAPPSERSAALGTFTAFVSLGFGLGPIALGAVAAGAGYRGAFLAGAAVAGLGLLASARFGRQPPASSG